MSTAPDTTAYHAVHRALRVAPRRLAAGARSIGDGDRRRVAAVATYWRGYQGETLCHHTIEDDIVFPALLRAGARGRRPHRPDRRGPPRARPPHGGVHRRGRRPRPVGRAGAAARARRPARPAGRPHGPPPRPRGRRGHPARRDLVHRRRVRAARAAGQQGHRARQAGVLHDPVHRRRDARRRARAPAWARRRSPSGCSTAWPVAPTPASRPSRSGRCRTGRPSPSPSPSEGTAAGRAVAAGAPPWPATTARRGSADGGLGLAEATVGAPLLDARLTAPTAPARDASMFTLEVVPWVGRSVLAWLGVSEADVDHVRHASMVQVAVDD